MFEPPVLEGDRVVLRPLSAAHRPALEAIRAEPGVRRWWGELEPDEDVVDSDGVAFAIEVAGEPAGAIQYFGPREVCDLTTRTLALEKA